MHSQVQVEALLKKLKEMKPPKITGKIELESEKKITADQNFNKKNNEEINLSESPFEEK